MESNSRHPHSCLEPPSWEAGKGESKAPQCGLRLLPRAASEDQEAQSQQCLMLGLGQWNTVGPTVLDMASGTSFRKEE